MSNNMYPPGCVPICLELSLNDLITQLKKLFSYLREKASNVEKNYLPLVSHLLNPGFLFHEEPVVKIMVACCLAELFHLFPDTILQFDDDELMDILTFYIQLLQYLGTVDNDGIPFFKTLLRTLNKTNAFAELLKSLQSLENKNCTYDKVILVICQGVCEREDMLKLESQILTFLQTFINSTKHYSEKGIATILKYILDENAVKHPIMYQLAGKIIRKCESILRFTVQMLLCNGLETDIQGEITVTTVYGHEFELIYKLQSICPGVILGSWKLVEILLLQSDSHPKKKAALTLLAYVFSEIKSNFSEQYRSLWLPFKTCVQEPSSFGRSLFVNNAHNFLKYHCDLQGDIVHMLMDLAKDSRATIRFGVVKAIRKATKYNIQILEDNNLIQVLEDLIWDTNDVVYKEAFITLGLIYRRTMDSDSNMVTVAKQIVNTIMHLYKTPYDFNEYMGVIEKIIVKGLVPCELPQKERMIKLLQLWCLFDGESSRNFHWCLQLKKRAHKMTHELLSLYKESPEGSFSVINLKREVLCGKLSLTMGNQKEMHPRLCSLVKELVTNKRLYTFLEKYIEEGNCAEDFEKLWAENQEILSFKSQTKKLRMRKTLSPEESMALGVKQLCAKVGDFLMNEQSMKQLQQLVIECVNNSDVMNHLTVDQKCAVKLGIELLYVYYNINPQWGFQDLSIIEGLNFLGEYHSECVLKIFSTLSSYKPLGETFPNILNGTLVPHWKEIIITGIPIEAKHAVHCLCSHIKYEDEDILIGVLEEFVQSMNGPELYLTGIISLGYFGTYLPKHIEKSWLKTLFELSLKVQQKLVSAEAEELSPDDAPWHDKNDLPYAVRCEVEALKAITRFVIRFCIKQLTYTVLSLLNKIAQGNGNCSQTATSSLSAKAWLRFTSGCCFLKLCDKKKIYVDQVPRKFFFQMAELMKDESLEVRRRFSAKLCKKLMQWDKQKFGLPSVFISYFALCALENNSDLKSEMEQALNQCVEDKRQQAWSIYHIGKIYTGTSQMHTELPQVFPEFCVHVAVELLALLVYDTIDDNESMQQVYICLGFLFNALLGTKNGSFVNFSTNFFRGLFESIKRCKNVVEPENNILNKKMWAICEIGQYFLTTVPSKVNNYAESPVPRIDPSYMLPFEIDNRNIKHLPPNVEKYLSETLTAIQDTTIDADISVEDETEYDESASDMEEVAILYPDRGEIIIQKQSRFERGSPSTGTGTTSQESNEEQTPRKKMRQQLSRLQKLKWKRSKKAHKQ